LALDSSRCAYTHSSIVTLVPPNRATSLGGMPAASAQLIPECLSVYGVTLSGSPAASRAVSNSHRRKFLKS